jgi:hypothetical protein
VPEPLKIFSLELFLFISESYQHPKASRSRFDLLVVITLIAHRAKFAGMVDCDGLFWSKAWDCRLLVVFLKRLSGPLIPAPAGLISFHQGIKTALAYRARRGIALVPDQAGAHIVYGVARIARYTEIHTARQTAQRRHLLRSIIA